MRAPPQCTVERWCWDYVLGTGLEAKFAPPPVPEAWESCPPARRLARPGRPPELRVAARSPKTPRPGALRAPAVRARMCATFLHHELQAAELMAWALLAFPATPRDFRAGLVRVLLDEVRHMRLYRAHLAQLGARVGEEPVRDWFWERVPACRDATSFVALVGLGFEGGNLEHARTFAARFRAAGDERGGALLEQVAREEVAHVAFARSWFERWTGGLEFDEWVARLPRPLTPTVLRGRPLARSARRRAGLTDAFLAALERWDPGSGS